MRIGYARVSTQDQSLDRQRDQLRQDGCERIYEEKVSGARSDRPELARMLDALRRDDVICGGLTYITLSRKDKFRKRKETRFQLGTSIKKGPSPRM